MRGFIAAHGGQITIDSSEDGRGTTFTLVVPKDSATSSKNVSESAEPGPDQTRGGALL